MKDRTSKPIDPQQALAERKSKFIERVITEWVVRRCAEDALTRDELASLDSTQRIIAQKHSLLDNFAHFYRRNPCADVAPGCLLFVTVFADNNMGACMYSQERIAKFLSRSERTIRDAMQRLEDDGVIYRDKNGRSYACWPAVHRAFVSDRAHSSWFVDALAPRDRKQPSGIGANEYRKQSSGVAKQYRKQAAAIPEAGGATTSLIDFPKENKQMVARQNFYEVRRCQLPSSAQLSSEGMAYAVSQGMTEKEAQEAFEEFSDHHIANGNLKNDWNRTWKQWVRIAFRDGHMARKRGAAGQGAKGTAASSKSKDRQFSTDALVFELAAKRDVAATELNWLRKLLTMQRQKSTDPIEWGTLCIEMTGDHETDVLRRAADAILKKSDWLPSHKLVFDYANHLAAVDDWERKEAKRKSEVAALRAQLDAMWTASKDDPDAEWRHERGRWVNDEEYERSLYRAWLSSDKELHNLGEKTRSMDKSFNKPTFDWERALGKHKEKKMVLSRL
jgi:hypothetical protein